MLKELLDSNWLPSADAETLEQSCPEKLFFLQEEFISKMITDAYQGLRKQYRME